MHMIQGSLKGRTNDETDLVVFPISCGLEFLLCVREGFRDIKAVKVDRSFLLDLARQRLGTTLYRDGLPRTLVFSLKMIFAAL